MAGPIGPEDVAQTKQHVFPAAVFEAFNELIAMHYVNGYAKIQQTDVIKLMLEKGLARQDIFGKGWLNVEDVYRSAGWIVTYDKPGYNESYPATFTFEKAS